MKRIVVGLFLIIANISVAQLTDEELKEIEFVLVQMNDVFKSHSIQPLPRYLESQNIEVFNDLDSFYTDYQSYMPIQEYLEMSSNSPQGYALQHRFFFEHIEVLQVVENKRLIQALIKVDKNVYWEKSVTTFENGGVKINRVPNKGYIISEVVSLTFLRTIDQPQELKIVSVYRLGDEPKLSK